VLIRASSLARATATKTLFYQLGISALVLPLASFLLGEPLSARFALAALLIAGGIVLVNQRR
jgi:drug/metabolite transporter (DMT)-like permease